MRRMVLAVIMAGVVHGAQAADLPDLPVLRGALREGFAPTRWQGFYVGAQYGGSNTNFRSTDVNSALTGLGGNLAFVNPAITTTVLPDKSTASGAGGFIGYNWQWDDAVLGIDANYSVGGQRGLAQINSVSTTQAYGGGLNILATTSGSARMNITDYGAIRGRAGWAAGVFLPYVTAGFALGRADLARTVTVDGIIDPGGANGLYGPVSATQHKNGAFIYGYSYGGGLDVHLLRGLFARGEVEVTRFIDVWGLEATVTTARGGLGYKF